MANEKDLKNAKKAYDTLCAMLDDNDYKYEKHEEDLVVTFGVRGEDLPMDIVAAIDEDRQLVRIFSKMPFKVDAEKRIEVAIALCQTNYNLVDGSFDFDLADGSVIFRITSSFRECLISKDLFEFMIAYSCFVVDRYNDQLLMLNKGTLSLEDYISQL